MTFVDLTKAFYSALKIMTKFYCPAKFIAMVRQAVPVRVQYDSEYSEPFSVVKDVKHGYVLAPTQFSIMFSAMFTDVFQDCNYNFPIRYRFDSKLFNPGRLQAKSKVQTKVVDALLSADGMTKKRKM